jgi:hypothetical protein
MHMDTATWMWGLLFGGLGLGYFVYGRKQRRAVPLIIGLALMAFPYVVTNPYALVGIGVVLMAVPYFVRL